MIQCTATDSKVLLIGCSGFVHKDSSFQGIGSIVCRHPDIGEVSETIAIGRCSNTDSVLASILIASNAIVESSKHVTQVHVFVDSVSAAQCAFDMSIHSLQGSSLSISERLQFWFDASPLNQLTFHYVPSGAHWNIQHSAFKLSKSISIADIGNISLDVKLKEITSGCLKEWFKLFQSPDYRGHQFFLFFFGSTFYVYPACTLVHVRHIEYKYSTVKT